MIIYATQPNNIGSTFSVNSTSFYLTDLQIEQILTRNNFKIANNYEGLVAASGTNFMRVMADYPDITLYRTDNLHPTVAGSYLAACTIYYRMFNKSPYGNKFGSVCFDGKEIDEMNDRDAASKIGYVQQNPDNQLVTENRAQIISSTRLKGHRIDKRVRSLLHIRANILPIFRQLIFR